MKWKDWDRNLKVRLLGEFMINLLFWMFFPYMAIYFADSLGKEQAGILLVISQLVGVLTNLIGGYCADQYGRKKMMFIAAAGQTVAFGVFALANSPWLDSPVLTFIGFTALGLFGSLYWPASHAMVADVVSEKNRNEVFAVFYTSINISVVFGPALGSIFFFNNRFELLLACMIVSFILTIVLKKYIRETVPKRAPEVEKKQLQKKTWRTVIGGQLQDYRVIATDRKFLLFILAGILVAQTFMQLDLLIAVYTTEQVPTQSLFSFGNWSLMLSGKELFGYIVSANGLLVALLTVFMSKWINKYKEGNVFVISSLLYGVGILLYGNTTLIWLLFMGIVIFTIAELMVVGIQESFISQLAPEHMRGQYFAAAGLRFSIGRAIAPLAIPLTIWIGYQWTFFILFLLTIVAAYLYRLMFKMMDRYKGQQQGREVTSTMKEEVVMK
ncbi:major facilitator superfamily permease [Fictibacillus macauensis ZFHKF-1]|uniref:Major facilitator superfamily permease n=1 Tax=Fictibacillus macauensis ZFHKF-1 TaxID=1196324 RepID=I8UG33_9BACL|nr:MFS transporter [Fictibacillus macauensis]EIT85860.1 major facilitator superfamily permease [Fictibacillus macauensis ZFHKF-1]